MITYVGFRLREGRRRWARAFRYGFRCPTPADAEIMFVEAQRTAGLYALGTLTVDEVFRYAADRYEPGPMLYDLARLAADAVWREHDRRVAGRRDALVEALEWIEREAIRRMVRLNPSVGVSEDA